MATTVQAFYKANPTYIGNAGKRPKKQTGRGGFLSSIISELGGAGGAAGGMALGASLGSVVPGLGTLIGGALGGAIGGFAGGTAGRGIENKVRDNQNFFGAGGSAKSAFGEGALSGALGGLGAGASALRGVKAVGGLRGLKAVSGGDDALIAASKSILKGGKKAGLSLAGEGTGGRIISGASRLESRALGFGQGEKVGGQVVKPKDVAEFFKTMKTEGIKSGHPDVVGRQIEAKLGKVSQGIDDALSAANRPLTRAEQNFLKNGFGKEISENIVLANSPAAQKLANGLYRDFGKISSLEDIVKQRRNVQAAINFARTNTAAVPGTEEVLWAAQRHLNKLAGTFSDDLLKLNKSFAGLTRLEDATLNASKNLTAQSRSAVSGLTGSLKAGDTATAAKSSVGALGRRIGGGLDLPSGVALARGARGVASRGIANNMFTPGQTQELVTPDSIMSQADPTMDTPQQTRRSRFPLEVALAAIQAYPKQASDIIKMYEFVQKAEGGGAKADASAAKAQNANAIIDRLEGVFTQAGGAKGPVAGRIEQAMAAAGGGNQALKSYQDLRSAYTSQISRALGEVGVLTDKDREVIQRAIPSVNDSREAALIKIQTLRNILGDLSGRGGADTNDLAGILQSLGPQAGY